MKICIPITNNRGLDSEVCEHFGSAPSFLIYNLEDKSEVIVENSNAEHQHGMCNPLSQISGHNVDAVICRGMGSKAVQRLNEGGIKAYRTVLNGLTVKELLKLYELEAVSEITIETACSDHSCH